MSIINGNATRGCLSDNYLIPKFIAQNIWSQNIRNLQ